MRRFLHARARCTCGPHLGGCLPRTRQSLTPHAPPSPRLCQADGSGAKLVAPAAPAGTDLAAQFSITWQAVPPSKIGELQAAAFKAAMLKQLPAGGWALWGGIAGVRWCKSEALGWGGLVGCNSA